MAIRAFDSSVSFWRMAADKHGVIRCIRQEGEWSLGHAIDVVIHEPFDEQWRFEVISDGEAIDHVGMRHLAATSVFQAWTRSKAHMPLFLWSQTG